MSEIGTYIDLTYLNSTNHTEQAIEHKWYKPGTYIIFPKYTESIAQII